MWLQTITEKERNRVDAWIEDFKLLLWSSMRVWVCIDFRTPKIKIALTRILYDSTSEQKLLSNSNQLSLRCVGKKWQEQRPDIAKISQRGSMDTAGTGFWKALLSVALISIVEVAKLHCIVRRGAPSISVRSQAHCQSCKTKCEDPNCKTTQVLYEKMSSLHQNKHGFCSAISIRDIRKTIGVPWNDWSDDAAGQPLFQSFSHICDMSWLKSLTHVKSIWYHLQSIHPFKGCVMHWLRRQCPLVKQATPLALEPLLQIFAATGLRVPRVVCKNRSTPETKHIKTHKSLCVYENLG